MTNHSQKNETKRKRAGFLLAVFGYQRKAGQPVNSIS
jgi:hypothetical protein